MNFSETKQNRCRENREKSKNRFFFPPLLVGQSLLAVGHSFLAVQHRLRYYIATALSARVAALVDGCKSGSKSVSDVNK